MGRMIPVSGACGCSQPISPVTKALFIIAGIVFLFGLYTAVQKVVDNEKIRHAQFVKTLNECECAKHKERNVISVSGLLSGNVYVKTVVVCKNGSVLTNLADVEYFGINYCDKGE